MSLILYLEVAIQFLLLLLLFYLKYFASEMNNGSFRVKSFHNYSLKSRILYICLRKIGIMLKIHIGNLIGKEVKLILNSYYCQLKYLLIHY